MTCLLQQHLPATPFNKVVEFGCGTGNYSRLLYHTLQPKQFFLNDLCNGMQACCHDLLDQGAIFLTGDAETLDFPEDTELLTSCSTLQWFESPENFFHRCHHRLSRNGYLAITTFGQENMKEIRSVTGQGLPYRSLSELEAALTPHYDLIHSEEERLHRSFPSPLQVLYHLKESRDFRDSRILRALATAGLFGNVVRTNASVSGAEVGCQGEVGVACAMAAAAASQLFGGTPAQIEYAAEMGLEHHLGLTCDPVCGLVQIPCIERNAFAAARALDANTFSNFSDGKHRVSFDQVVEVMRQTGNDLPSLYKETSEGGLAKNMEQKKSNS